MKICFTCDKSRYRAYVEGSQAPEEGERVSIMNLPGDEPMHVPHIVTNRYWTVTADTGEVICFVDLERLKEGGEDV